jgi:hypothetical protein
MGNARPAGRLCGTAIGAPKCAKQGPVVLPVPAWLYFVVKQRAGACMGTSGSCKRRPSNHRPFAACSEPACSNPACPVLCGLTN